MIRRGDVIVANLNPATGHEQGGRRPVLIMSPGTYNSWPIGMAIELLAGIPSIIYGMWGFFVLGPFLANTFQPFMIKLFDGVPVLGQPRGLQR